MDNPGKQTTAAPIARQEFARRLRELRIPRGFRTARSLARALNIDENRYTRYERAEVEPDLDMIRRICETLGVTPTELLGPGDVPVSAARANGHVGPMPPHANGAVSKPAREIATAAWLLAEAATDLRQRAQGADGLRQPLAGYSRTGVLYKALMEHPYEAITGLLDDPAIAGADPVLAASLQERIKRLVGLLRE